MYPSMPICTNTHIGLDLRTYTSGRFLRRDKQERDARYLAFDFHALRNRVLELCPGAVSIAKYEKQEGGHNIVFIFTCDNARRLVARLPTAMAGPAGLTTNSEVANIRYSKLDHPFRTKLARWSLTLFLVQSSTTVPTPKILDWSDDPSNAIGSEYIITRACCRCSVAPEMTNNVWEAANCLHRCDLHRLSANSSN